MFKILIIEDEEDLARVLSKRLREHAFDVVFATDAYAGVKMAHDEKPDLVILDLMLPAGGGMSVLQNIRRSAKTSFIPVIIVTGMNDDEYKKKVVAFGVDGYFEKPYDMNELIGTMSSILQKTKRD